MKRGDREKMKRKTLLFMISILLFTLYITYSLVPAIAGKARIGVLNVSPEYRSTRIIQKGGILKAYLTISDYNSWRDIYLVDLFAEDRGIAVAHFRFKHYETTNDYKEINKFYEVKGKGYLLPEECNVSHSSLNKTVDDRCLLNVVFAFTPIFSFNRILIVTYDRGGLIADASIDYNGTGNFRNENFIIPFWANSPIRIPPDLLDTLAISIALTTVAIVIRKRNK